MRALGAVGEGLAELSLGPGAEDVSFGVGGDVANVCVMAARLDVPARLAGRVGDDGLGHRLLAFWRDAGVDVASVQKDTQAPTGLYINEDLDGEGHRFTYWRSASAGSRFARDDLVEAFFQDLGILVVSGVTIAISPSVAVAAEEAVRRSRAHGGRVACVLNHRPVLGGDVASLARLAVTSDIVLGSRKEVEAVFGISDPDLLARRPELSSAEVVITDGANPATVSLGGTTIRQPVPSAEVRNAAGAGDALAGAYLAGRLLGRSPCASLELGVAAATLSVRDHGCSTSYPSGAEASALADRLPSRAPAASEEEA